MLGIKLVFHGIMPPITGMSAFVETCKPTFADAFLPVSLVRFSLYLIPPAELIVGVLTELGLFTRWALISGVLIFALAGHAVRPNWGGSHLVMQYVPYYAAPFGLRSQWLALDTAARRQCDGWLGRRSPAAQRRVRSAEPPSAIAVLTTRP